MEDFLPEQLYAYARRPARSLREACQRVGRDKGGRYCVDCRLRELCHGESRWLVRRAANPSPPRPLS